MVKLSIKGTLGKFGYSALPDSIVDDILQISGMKAYTVAKGKAPYLDEHPIHIRDSIHTWYDKAASIFYVIVSSLYANITEFGSKLRFPHPFIRPAAKAAQTIMRSTIRKSTKDAVNKRKSRAK
jgi:hypothetical protein